MALKLYHQLQLTTDSAWVTLWLVTFINHNVTQVLLIKKNTAYKGTKIVKMLY